MGRAQAFHPSPTRRFTVVDTPVGRVRISWTPRGICGLERLDGETPSTDAQPGRRARGSAGSDAGGAAEAADRDDRRRAEFKALLDAWFAGADVQVPVDLEAAGLSPFARAVLEQVSRIPRGQVRSYADIARALGRPRAARAVGNAVAANPIALLIPCHRVVRADGRLGEYSAGGPAVKERLLRLEGAWPPPPSPPPSGRANG